MSLATPAYKGMSYTSWGENAMLQPGSDQSLVNMRQVGVDTVAINVWEFQDDENSTVISPDFTRYSSSEASLRHAIEFAQAHGMKVLLKPMLDLRNGDWRANINPSDAWFTAYTGFMDKYADIAQQEGVAMLSVGCEFVNAQTWDGRWRNVVSSVRGRFGGKLTYSANWGSEGTVSWWDVLDEIGIDAYYPLSYSEYPTLAELQAGWQTHADQIGSWLTGTGLNKKIMFTEAGYRSVKGAAAAPWDYSFNGPVDLQLQANCYDALLGTLYARDWFDGVMFWNWETDPNAGGPNDTGYTPQNKPASDVLARYYGATPEPASVVALGLGVAAVIRRRRKPSDA